MNQRVLTGKKIKYTLEEKQEMSSKC